MTEFNAAKARTKYALPLWVDAFLRDTMGLSADEIGSYNLLLWAMWGRESCDLPDDDKELARIARATPQTWKRRIRPALERFFSAEDGYWTNTRLLREAEKTERFLARQSARKSGSSQKTEPTPHHGSTQSEPKKSEEKSRNSLKPNEAATSADASMDVPADLPTQETKNPSFAGGGSDDVPAREADALTHSASSTYREKLLIACGADPVSGITGHGGVHLGAPDQILEANRWRDELGLTEEEIIQEIERVMERKRDGPPKTLTYFTAPLERLAGRLIEARSRPINAQQLTSIPRRQNGKSSRKNHASALDETIRRVSEGEINLGTGSSDPFRD